MITLLMVIGDAIVVLAQGVDAIKPLLVLNIGISAPLILKALATSMPVQNGTRSLTDADEEFTPSIGDFIAGC